MALVRLQKFLAECGVASRRKSEELITEGKVRVNGKTITVLGSKVDPDTDTVYVKNKPVNKPQKGVLLFSKPREVVSTLSDPEGRPCVGDYLTKHYRSYFPVGRLDFDTSGLMVLTNDGELAEHLMHPRFGWERIYRVRVEGSVSDKIFEKMRLGVKLADGMITARGSRISSEDNSSWIEVIVTEGRNRLVRRLMDKLKHPVIKLQRVAYGPFHIGKLKPGEMMKLSEKQYTSYRYKIMSRTALSKI